MTGVTFCHCPEVDDAELSYLHDRAFGESGGTRRWSEQLAGHSLGWVCAYDGDGLVGFVNVAWDGDLHAFLVDTAVLPGRQREGIGSGLVREAMRLAREAGCRYVHVDTAPELLDFYVSAAGMVPATAGIAAIDELDATTPGLVRVGSTLRRPAGPWVPTIQALLDHLAAEGFPAPRSRGLDQAGREVLDWVPGVPGWLAHARYWRSPEALTRAARLVRRLHDLLDVFVAPPGAVWRGGWGRPGDGGGPICHNDLAPWNFVVGPGNQLSVIDWDGAGPGDRMAELAYAIAGFVPLKRDAACRELGWLTPPSRVERIELFRSGYGLPDEERPRLADAIVASARSGVAFGEAMHAQGREPWSSRWAADQGAGDREDLALTEAVVSQWQTTW